MKDVINNTYDDFHKIVINELPLIDVRAPIEYNKGTFINSFNLPLMSNEERHVVGICYKEKGHEEAVKLGHELVSGKTRQNRTEAWADYLSSFPNSLLYCFRGGLRSQISQQWILEKTGISIPRLEGGYKAFRNFLMDALDPSAQQSTPIILGGYTGSGKTILLHHLENSIDLEGLANHRGSSFGQFVTPQPCQINFENNLAYGLIQHKEKNHKHLVLEDEGRNIGKCFIPKNLVTYFNSGQLVVLETPLEERIQITLEEYVIQAQEKFCKTFGQEIGLQEWYSSIIYSTNRIKKRLGFERHTDVLNAIECAFQNQKNTGEFDSHKNWITILLQEYYDPMYRHQLQKKCNSVTFKGNSIEVLEYLSKMD